MKKQDFITLLLGTVGLLVFGLGMCMCLIPEWGMASSGKLVAAVGLLVLLILVAFHCKASGKKVTLPAPKVIASVVLGVVGALVLGVGMCLIMVWNIMLPGIVLGIVGIVLLLCLIPLTVGLK